MNSKRRICIVCLSLLALIPSALRADEGIEDEGRFAVDLSIDQDDINLGFADADQQEVAGLIEDLGAFEYTRREKASAELRKLGPAAFRVMSHAYRTTHSDEIRSRIADIARSQFLWHTLLKHRGFLGIAFQPETAPSGAGSESGIRVTEVRQGTAAAAGRIKAGDLICSVDGRPIDDANGGERFRDIIERKGAGGTVVLQVLRRGGKRELERIQLVINVGARPLHQYADPQDPDMVESLNRQLQAFNIWWNEYFALPEEGRERTPSSSVFELPN